MKLAAIIGRSTAGAAALAAFYLLASACVADEIADVQKRSGYAFMSRETQAMQDDDRVNPGMLWVLEGEALWSAKAGNAGRACADCHGDAANAMKGVAARYPDFDAKSDRPIDLEQRINRCRTEHQAASALAWESKELLALTAYVARQSRGMPTEAGGDARLRPFVDGGRDLFGRRQGQINIACSQCHDDNWGKRLAGNTVPQAHPTGYPLYRLEWQGMASLQRRLRACMIAIRAQPYDYGAPQNVDLELYLMWRARGMPLETPAVRP
jgi:L-cysteine S-thiosulfotransferase